MLHRALKLLRIYHHISQIELSKTLGISNSYLSEIESGNKTPSLEILNKYGDFFKMPISSILLFSELIHAPHKPGSKLKFFAADKILKLLEWLSDQNDVKKP